MSKLQASHKLLIASCTLSLLSGCFTVPDLPFLNDQSTQGLDSNITGLAASRDAQRTNIDLFEEERKRDEITQLRQQINELMPSINRVLDMEADLKLAIETFEKNNASGLALVNHFPGQYQESSADKFSSVQANAVSPGLNMDDKFSDIQAKAVSPGLDMDDKFSNVQANAASPIIDMDDKFSSPTKAKTETAQKFSQQSANVQNATAFPSNCQTPMQGTGFAIHLASFKKRESAVNIISNVLNQLSKEIDCPLSGMIAPVSVDDTLFYSARLGAFDTRQAATQICEKAKKYNSYCTVTVNSGDRI